MKHIGELVSKISDREIKEVWEEFLKYYPDYHKKELSEGKFGSDKEYDNYMMELLSGSLNEMHKKIKEEISVMLRQGKKVNEIGIRAMALPLKIRLLKASCSRKDLEKVFAVIDRVKEDLKEAKNVGEGKNPGNQK